MSRFLFILSGIVVAGFILFQFNQRPLADFVFERALEKRVEQLANAERIDGIHVYICGAGGPMPSHNAGPCTAILAGNRAFIFDVGSGSPRKLGMMSFPMAALEGVFLTHLHSDHFDSLGELLLVHWVGEGRDTPLPIHGPTGTEEVVNGFNAAYRIDSTFRTAHHGPDIANPEGFGGSSVTVEEGVVYDENGVKITATSVIHHPVEPAFAYRIDYKGRSVTISGDTILSEAFVAMSSGVDIMIHESLQPTMIKAMGETMRNNDLNHTATIMDDILDYHASPEEAAQAASDADAKILVLNHIVPPLPVKMIEPVFIGDARKQFDGRLYLAEDGMTFTLPAESDTITMDKEL